jgi:anthranilate synthase component 1
MAAGLFGYMGYDMVRLMERLPTDKAPGLGLPDSMFLRPTVMAIFDNVEDLVTIVTSVWPGSDQGARAAYNQACERLADTVADFGRNLPERRDEIDALADLPEPTSNISQGDYHRMVERAKEYILAGDIFQVVLSQRFQLPFTLPPFSLYRALRRLNPSPFLFFLDLGGFTIVGSSPEILVRLRDGRVTIRPIAGTRRRGATPAEDRELAAELLGDPKERAEHLMLLDLGRNDVGRVAEIGSVEVTEQFIIEYYSHVMHIVSNVEGDIRPGLDAIAALAAGFPAGTVSGAPKVRAMEIIDELEPERRGVYAGAIGYFAASGAMDTCIALRTAVVKDGTMYVQAGGGIVADSTAEGEYQECIQKARALVRAAQEAVRFAADKGRNR